MERHLRKLRLVVCLSVFLVCPGVSSAIISNPNPALFHNDDNTQIFNHQNSTIGIELLDFFGLSPAWSSSFGFFFNTNPSTLIPVFGPEDQGATGSQKALINFVTGIVRDLDNLSVQSTFTNSSDPIGFYLNLLHNTTQQSMTLYTLSSLNSGGVDLAASFPLMSDPSVYLIGFELPGGATISFNLVGKLEPFAGGGGGTPVPEPGTLLLVSAGMALVAASARRYKNR